MIRIGIKTLNNRITFLTININDTIDEVKKKFCNKICIKYKDMQFKFFGRVLNGKMTVGDYDIEDEDIIEANDHSQGGEVGSQAKGLTDPNKKGPVKYSTINDGPEYLTVDDGINLFGICKNKKCIAYHKEVCSIFGFGTFDLIKDTNEISEKCPKCPSYENPLLKLETCGFKRCKYSYNGYKIEDKKPVYVNYNNSILENNILDYFPVSIGENKIIWVELKITANPL